MKHKASMINDLTTGSVSRNLIAFALPIVLANLLQTIYNMVDMVIVGRFVGKAGLSSVSIGADLLQLFTLLAMGMCSAGQIIISQFVGADKRKSVTQTIGTMFTVILSGAVIFTIVCLALTDTFLSWLNTPPEAFANARIYCITCFSGLFFIYGYNLVSAILRGMGDSRHPLLFIAIAATVHLILALIFVAGFKWSVFGAALATVIGQAISFIASLILLYSRREEFGFDFKPASFKVSGEILRKLLRLGIPMCLQSIAINFSVLFVNSYINAYGVVASAVSGIGSKLGSITSVIAQALSTAGGSMVGQSLGAGKPERVPKILRFSLTVNLSYASVLAAFTLLMPRQIFGLFNSDPEVLDMAMIYIPCATLNFFGASLRAPFFAIINGVGYSRLNLAVGLLDGVICRIGLAILLGITFGLGIQGFWYGSVLAGFVPTIIGSIFYMSGKWRTHKLVSAD